MAYSNYGCVISTEPKNEYSFCVMLLDVPEFPDSHEMHPMLKGRRLAVIAATTKTDNKWTYNHLTREEKEEIGNALVKLKCKPRVWYWCNLYIMEGVC